MRIYQEETFGPFAPIVKVDSAAQALTLANDADYGLSMAVFTSSLTTAYEMSEGLQPSTPGRTIGSWEARSAGTRKAESAASSETMRCAFTNVKTVSFTLL
jgi:hypothetical protein